jgi:hypothetical protein
MKNEANHTVEVQVRCDLSYFLTITDETLKQAIAVVEKDAGNYRILTEELDVHNFVSAISKINEVSISREDDVDSETFFEAKSSGKKILGLPFTTRDLVSNLPWLFLVFLIFFFAPSIDINPPIYFALALGISLSMYGFGELLFKEKIYIPNLFVRYPNGLKDSRGVYKFEVTGPGFVRLFFDDTTDEEAKAKAKYILGIEQNPTDEVIYITHSIMLTHLGGIFLCNPENNSRTSKNLVSPLRRKLIYSLFWLRLQGLAQGFGIVAIPGSIWLWFFR